MRRIEQNRFIVRSVIKNQHHNNCQLFIIMPQTLTCRITGTPFEVSDREMMIIKRFGVPPPDLCPEERMRRLMAFRNEWKLYRRKCDATGETIVSAYPPDSPFTVYKNSIWWGDSWDATQYGRDFDFNREFFEQFAELQRVVPREGTSVFNCENCEYNSHVRNSKNCYLNSLMTGCENTHYSYWMVNDHNVQDCGWTNNSTLCYDCVNIETCYECVNLQEAKDCSDCHFSFQLLNCHHCLFSANLINAEYRVLNKPVTKEEFETFKAEYLNGSFISYKQAHEKFMEIRQNAVQRAVQLINCEHCTGDHLLDSKNCRNCFDGQQGEDCFNSISISNSKDLSSIYSAGWPHCEMIYMSLVSRDSINIAFCNYSFFSSNLFYCDSTNSSHECFGCVGLRQKRWCILNKQYRKDEYYPMIKKIKEYMMKTRSAGSGQAGEWGQFFPASLSPYAFNETAAIDFFPLTKDQAIAQGFRWSDFEQPVPQVSKLIPSERLPDSIADTPDEILDWAIQSASGGKPFRIIPHELEFYRRMKLPIPRMHPEKRHHARQGLRNPMRLLKRPCTRCAAETLSTIPGERPEKVYCEQCYRAHLYG